MSQDNMLEIAIGEVVKLKGEEIYQNGTSFKNALADLLKNKNTANLVGIFLDKGLSVSVLRLKQVEEKNLRIEKRRLVLKLASQTFIPEDLVEEVVLAFCNGICLEGASGAMPVPEKVAGNPSPKKPSATDLSAFVIMSGTILEYIGSEADVVIPDCVRVIGKGAFSSCRSLNSVVIPDSVTTIKYYAFAECANLTSVEMGNSVIDIDDYAFTDCFALTSLVLSSSLSTVGMYTFSNCDRLTCLELPDSVTCVEEGAFFNCKSLTSLKLPDSMTSIERSAFAGCSGLTSLEIPDSITVIDDNGFIDCSSLVTVEIPDSVTIIGESAFASCSSLVTVVIPESVTRIEASAFEACSLLRNLDIKGKPSVGKDAFKGTVFEKHV